MFLLDWNPMLPCFYSRLSNPCSLTEDALPFIATLGLQADPPAWCDYSDGIISLDLDVDLQPCLQPCSMQLGPSTIALIDFSTADVPTGQTIHLPILLFLGFVFFAPQQDIDDHYRPFGSRWWSLCFGKAAMIARHCSLDLHTCSKANGLIMQCRPL